MPKKSGKKSAHGGKGSAASARTGPIGVDVPGTVVRVPPRNQLERVVNLRSVQTVGVDSGHQWDFGATGVSNQNIASFLTSSNTWANNAALYDQFRVESVTLSYVPLTRYVSTSFYNSPVCFFYDADHVVGTMPAVTPSSAVCYGTQKTVGLSDPWEITWTIVQPAAGIWYDTDTTAEQGGCIFGQTLYSNPPSGVDLGTLVTSARVRFRGQKD